MSSRMEVRAAICGLAQAGMSPSKIAATLKIARTTVYRTLNKKSAGKSLQYDSTSRKKTKLTPRVAASLRRMIKPAPTKSLRQVAVESGQNRELVRRLVQLSGWQSLRRTTLFHSMIPIPIPLRTKKTPPPETFSPPPPQCRNLLLVQSIRLQQCFWGPLHPLKLSLIHI